MVAVFIRYAGLLALFGLFGDQILGGPSGLWTEDTAPALYAEQIAVATALLWIGQSMHHLKAKEYTVFFHSQVAGWGANGQWGASGELAAKIRTLEQYVQGMTGEHLHFQHVHSHRGHPWNELVDVIAKRAATNDLELAKPPRANCEAFLRLDMTWMATVAKWGPSAAIHHSAGKWLVIRNGGPPQGSPLQPDELIPMTGAQRTMDQEKDNTFALKCTTINVQGLRAKNKYLADQLHHEQYQVVFMQETKSDGGTWIPGDYLRLSTNSEKHWGVAIWLQWTANAG